MSYITRYEPYNLLNKFLEQTFRPLTNSDTSNIETSQWMPAVDIKETKKQFVIEADLPGVDKKNVNISMENNTLTIQGSREEEKKEEDQHYYRTERVRGSFYRRFTLPDTADSEKIAAKMVKGILEITIPKKEIAQPRSIKINVE